MIYCDDCADEHGWPESVARLVAKCEFCGEYDRCSNRSSSQLPRDKRAKELKPEVEELPEKP